LKICGCAVSVLLKPASVVASVVLFPFTYYSDEGKVTKESANGGSARKQKKNWFGNKDEND